MSKPSSAATLAIAFVLALAATTRAPGQVAPRAPRSLPECNSGWPYRVTDAPHCPLYFIDGALLDTLHPPTCDIGPDEIFGVSKINRREGQKLFGTAGRNGILIITTKHPNVNHCRPITSPNDWPFAMGLGIPYEKPLWVVDGIPIDSFPPSTCFTEAADTMDIVSLSFIKEPDAAAIFGDRAIAGAILMTLKEPSRSRCHPP